eukprot:gb/GECG01002821.1/.p1 GENE.gb/GECG01002821.1/~~gb/GECG01002821.1/.p1  ORF type:complete len:377 (+),score=41.02 gb/GECG01002821.1/:1-1131(+)
MPCQCPPVVVDGANVALSGTGAEDGDSWEHCDIERIRTTIRYFASRGMRCFAFLPQWWIKNCDTNKKWWDPEYVKELVQKEKIITLTPSQAHDDHFILSYAKEHAGYVVTNDMFRDHVAKAKQPSQLKTWCMQRLIPYTFVDKEFLPESPKVQAVIDHYTYLKKTAGECGIHNAKDDHTSAPAYQVQSPSKKKKTKRCRFGKKCKKHNCNFQHPAQSDGKCKFGYKCQRRSCPDEHPAGNKLEETASMEDVSSPDNPTGADSSTDDSVVDRSPYSEQRSSEEQTRQHPTGSPNRLGGNPSRTSKLSEDGIHLEMATPCRPCNRLATSRMEYSLQPELPAVTATKTPKPPDSQKKTTFLSNRPNFRCHRFLVQPAEV